MVLGGRWAVSSAKHSPEAAPTVEDIARVGLRGPVRGFQTCCVYLPEHAALHTWSLCSAGHQKSFQLQGATVLAIWLFNKCYSTRVALCPCPWAHCPAQQKAWFTVDRGHGTVVP